MSNNPLNLAFRFILEMSAFALTIYWGWTNFQGIAIIPTAILLPFLLAFLWGAFRYPKDHGKGLWQVSGKTRLAIEAVVLTTPIILNYTAGSTTAATIFLLAVLTHYALSYDRVTALLKD